MLLTCPENKRLKVCDERPEGVHATEWARGKRSPRQHAARHIAIHHDNIYPKLSVITTMNPIPVIYPDTQVRSELLYPDTQVRWHDFIITLILYPPDAPDMSKKQAFKGM
jgi:hypothetical protein